MNQELPNLDHIEESKKKKNKKVRGIISIIVFLSIILILVAFRFNSFNKSSDGFFTDPTTPWYYKVGIFVMATLIVGLIIGFVAMANSKKKVSRWFSLWIVNIFTYIIIPGLVMTIIFLGAVSTKYPGHYVNISEMNQSEINWTDSHSGIPFEDNVRHAFSSNLLGESLTRAVMSVYNIGASRPTFWIYLCVAGLLISIWLSFPSKSNLLETLDAQELIDSINEKDYQDLERYEQRKAGQAAFWDKIDKNEKVKTIIIVLLLLIAIAIGIGFWIWG